MTQSEAVNSSNGEEMPIKEVSEAGEKGSKEGETKAEETKDEAKDEENEKSKDEKSKDEVPKAEETKDKETTDKETKNEETKAEETKDEKSKDEEPKDEEPQDKEPKDEENNVIKDNQSDIAAKAPNGTGRNRSSTSSSYTINEAAGITFLKDTLEKLIAIKEIAKKQKELVASAKKAIKILESGEIPAEAKIFDPLKRACEQKNIEGRILALDCLGKIFTFNIFNSKVYVEYRQGKESGAEVESASEGAEGGKVPLIDALIGVISTCFDGEGTDERVELQIIRVLTAAVVNKAMPVHGKALLQAVRQLYNIFLLSLSPANQGIAQATLMQVVSMVFDRVSKGIKEGEERGEDKEGGEGEEEEEEGEDKEGKEEVIGEDKEGNDKEGKEEVKDGKDHEDNDKDKDNEGIDTTPNNLPITLKQMQQVPKDVLKLTEDTADNDLDTWTRDAFLILRSMCNLSAKTIENEAVDMRSHAMRSKLISLYIVYFAMKNNGDLMRSGRCRVGKTRFVDAIKKHICLVLSRNSSSQIGPVYEVALEIFWQMVSRHREQFKYEIAVFFEEVYRPISEMQASTAHQKRYLLYVVADRLCRDGNALVELYLNYDCDAAMPNLCEEVVNLLARHAVARVDATPGQRLAYRESLTRGLATYGVEAVPELSTNRLASRAPVPESEARYPVGYALKMCAIGGLVRFLESIGGDGGAATGAFEAEGEESESGRDDKGNGNKESGNENGLASIASTATSAVSIASREGEENTNSPSIHSDRYSQSIHSDRYSQSISSVANSNTPWDSSKIKKTAFLECVRQFQFSPKKGLKSFAANNFLPDSAPETVARFLLDTKALDKSAIGEFLGSGDDRNVAIMHAFVDRMDFRGMQFMQALRGFLQHFRLPGESQKIDRFMLKFAEKYVSDNPGSFANADTVYVLSYSVVMLNTDLHSPQVKQRMTLEEFVRNNRGIDDGSDLDRGLLEGIYRDIQEHEIVLDSERGLRTAVESGMGGPVGSPVQSGAPSGIPGASALLFGVSRSLARQAYERASREMASNTERAVQSLGEARGGSGAAGEAHRESVPRFYRVPPGTDTREYARSMFGNLWMSFLAALTPPFKEYDDTDTAKLLLQGMRLSIHLACVLGVDYARTSFMRALVQFTCINSPADISGKCVDAVCTLLDVAITDQNALKTSWRLVFVVISQVERLRLLSRGVDAVPDLLQARIEGESEVNRNSSSSSPQKIHPDTAARLNSTHMDVAIDQVFAKSSQIHGDAIFDFLAGLSEVAREEINSSAHSPEPRMFSLQKLVDVCYYNMGRIRVQWSAMWAVLNETFSEFGCNDNRAVCFFAIDSLRQMAVRFFSIDELAHFKFQKDFLQPFSYIIRHNSDVQVRDMVLDCVHYLVAKNSATIRSGWASLLGILTDAAVNDDEEAFVSKGFRYASSICHHHLVQVRAQEAFGALVVCLTEYAKNDRFQKVSLQALHDIRGLVGVVGATEGPETTPDSWFNLLYAFHDVIMEGEDLEVRAQALDDLFNTLLKYGSSFDRDFWYRISNQILFPIFAILSQHWQLSTNQEDLWVWLSSTLIQALRRMITLFTTFYPTLCGMLDGYLNLLVSCICQENETISKVGISCLQELLLSNILRFADAQWVQIDKTFAKLFALTRATELFEADPKQSVPSLTVGEEESEEEDDEESEEEEENDESVEEDENESQQNDNINSLSMSRQKSTIVIKCVLQLHMIQTLSELFDNDSFYSNTPVPHLLNLAELLFQSYDFARSFNLDYNLRVRLWNSGVTDKLPNLLKQETSAVGVFISISFRLYSDMQKTDSATRKTIGTRLMPLSVTLLHRYAQFDEQEQARSIQNWVPVVVETVQACTEMDPDDFRSVCPMVYDYVLAIFDKSIDQNLRLSLHDFFARVGSIYLEKHQVRTK